MPSLSILNLFYFVSQCNLRDRHSTGFTLLGFLFYFMVYEYTGIGTALQSEPHTTLCSFGKFPYL